jgi:hypothetical protein
MADATDLLDQIRAVVREEVQPIKETQQEQGKAITAIQTTQQEQGKAMNALTEDVQAIRQEHGEKLNKLGEAVGRLEDGQNRQYTTMKILQGTIEETKAEVDKLLRRPRQAD